MKREDTNAKTEAWQRVLHFAADLVQYPKDAKPGLPSARAVALGLDDPKPEGAPTRAKKKGGVYDVAKRETSKLKTFSSPTLRYGEIIQQTRFRSASSCLLHNCENGHIIRLPTVRRNNVL